MINTPVARLVGVNESRDSSSEATAAEDTTETTSEGTSATSALDSSEATDQASGTTTETINVIPTPSVPRVRVDTTAATTESIAGMSGMSRAR